MPQSAAGPKRMPRSGEDLGIMDGDAEKRILSSVDCKLFVEGIVRFAHAAAWRLHKDWKLFNKYHELGAFHFYS